MNSTIFLLVFFLLIVVTIWSIVICTKCKKEEFEDEIIKKCLKSSSIKDRINYAFNHTEWENNGAILLFLHKYQKCCKIEQHVLLDHPYDIKKIITPMRQFLHSYKSNFKTFDAKFYEFAIMIESEDPYGNMEVFKEIIFHFPMEELNKINWDNDTEKAFYEFIESYTEDAYKKLQKTLLLYF